jgi:polyphosphate kinase 2 (PPK2 family)
LSERLGPRSYERRLAAAQARLNALAWKARRQGRSTVLVFEGWDAAGKGGAIRRVTAALDARLCRVIPVAAPTDEERARHYLWRFWRHLPRAGYVTIFDRSWYGRVLVERVEAFASPAEWMRAYDEIDHFEQQLAGHGIVVHKFWLHISPAEQLRRFDERGAVAHKQHKIGEEDWRNRARWADYELALEDMFARCSRPNAPWTIVAADDKRWARVTVVETLAERLEAALAE